MAEAPLLVKRKAGQVAAGTFTGNPKTATVAFAAAFPDNNYSVEITGVDERAWTYTKNASGVGFVINANANLALTGEVSWVALYNGEVA